MRNLLPSLSDWVPLTAFPLIVFGMLIATGNLTTGPRMLDDNQIYKLQIEFSEGSFFRVLFDEYKARFEVNRLVPVFSTLKVIQARMWGGNIVVWTISTGVIGACTAALLYCFLRLCNSGKFEAAVFALISVLGEQSVVWWRRLHGEGVGMLLLSTALVLMAFQIRTRKRRFEIAFSLCMTLAVFSKESFILTVPAVLLLKVWLSCRDQNITIFEAVKKSWLSILWLSAIFLAALAIVRFVIGKTEFFYTGWVGFDADRFANIVYQYGSVTNCWLLAALWLILVGSAFIPVPTVGGRSIGEKSRKDKKKRQKQKQSIRQPSQRGARLTMAALFWVTLTLPQLLLYMESGMLNVDNQGHYARYILPGIVGYAFLIAELIRQIRLQAHGRGFIMLMVVTCVCISLVDKAGTAYREGQHFAEITMAYDDWFESIAEHTTPELPIVLVYRNGLRGGGYSTTIALRIYYILSQRHDRGNIFYCPIPPSPTIEEARMAVTQADTRHHARKMQSVEKLPKSDDVQAIVILNLGRFTDRDEETSDVLDEYLLKRKWAWFDPSQYRRERHPFGHIQYFRTETN